MANTTTTRGPGTLSLLGVLFVALKLTGVINWSWWWVTLPFWGGLALFGGIALVVFIIALIAASADEISKNKRRKTITKRRY